MGVLGFLLCVHFVQQRHIFPQEMTWEFSFGKKKISLEINAVGEFRAAGHIRVLLSCDRGLLSCWDTFGTGESSERASCPDPMWARGTKARGVRPGRLRARLVQNQPPELPEGRWFGLNFEVWAGSGSIRVSRWEAEGVYVALVCSELFPASVCSELFSSFGRRLEGWRKGGKRALLPVSLPQHPPPPWLQLSLVGLSPHGLGSLSRRRPLCECSFYWMAWLLGSRSTSSSFSSSPRVDVDLLLLGLMSSLHRLSFPCLSLQLLQLCNRVTVMPSWA